jgi:hypothetical protein
MSVLRARLAPRLRHKVRRTNGGGLEIEESARADCALIFHGPATEDDIKSVQAINPVVAWWLKIRRKDHEALTPRIAEACAQSPEIEHIVNAYRLRRFAPEEIGPTAFARFDALARALNKGTR